MGTVLTMTKRELEIAVAQLQGQVEALRALLAMRQAAAPHVQMVASYPAPYAVAGRSSRG